MAQIRQSLSLFFEIGLSGLLDILIVTLVIYTFLVVLKRTRRSGLIFTGIVIVGAIYLLARKLNLLLTVALLQGFFAVILVALIVIFQEDLRFFFERMAALWLERGLPGYKRRRTRLPRREVEILARTLGDLARGKIGALVVLRGKDSIARHLEGGEDVDGLISESLLKSIFDPHSLGHDGAVVIGAGRIEKLGCHLPLSTNFDRLPRSGTRHAAALGISERSDALCLVVSEEQGTISHPDRVNLNRFPRPRNWRLTSRPFTMKLILPQKPGPGRKYFEPIIGRRPCLLVWRRSSGLSWGTDPRWSTELLKSRSATGPSPETFWSPILLPPRSRSRSPGIAGPSPSSDPMILNWN